MPMVIDYLSLDLEPPTLTLQALYKVFESGYTFRVVTYETDYYREQSTQEASRNFFLSKGYTLVQPGVQDDFYIHNSVLGRY